MSSMWKAILLELCNSEAHGIHHRGAILACSVARCHMAMTRVDQQSRPYDSGQPAENHFNSDWNDSHSEKDRVLRFPRIIHPGRANFLDIELLSRFGSYQIPKPTSSRYKTYHIHRWQRHYVWLWVPHILSWYFAGAHCWSVPSQSLLTSISRLQQSDAAMTAQPTDVIGLDDFLPRYPRSMVAQDIEPSLRRKNWRVPSFLTGVSDNSRLHCLRGADDRNGHRKNVALDWWRIGSFKVSEYDLLVSLPDSGHPSTYTTPFWVLIPLIPPVTSQFPDVRKRGESEFAGLKSAIWL